MAKYELSMLRLKSIDEDIGFLRDVNNGLIFYYQGKDIKVSISVIDENIKELYKYKEVSLEYAINALIELADGYFKNTRKFGPTRITIDSESIDIDMEIHVKKKIDQISDYITNLRNLPDTRGCVIKKVDSTGKEFYIPMSVQAIVAYRGSGIYEEQLHSVKNTDDIYELIRALERFTNDGFKEVITLPTYEDKYNINRLIFSDVIKLSKSKQLNCSNYLTL